MHICLIGYIPTATAVDDAISRDLRDVCRYAVSLARQGHAVHWVSAPETVHAGASKADFPPAGRDEVPGICRYVVPYQAYRLEDVHVVGIESSVWHQQALHTRLFTFLCLLHRALPYDVLHAWGAVPSAYLTVYTARFLGLPAVVSYSEASFRDGSQSSFPWQWVARHLSRALVGNRTDRTRLLATTDLRDSHVWLLDPTLPEAAAIMTTHYESLRARERP